MTEAQVGHLLKSAMTLAKGTETNQVLKSYYLMRCKLITKGFGLPRQHFSEEVRCSRCCIEWSNKTNIKLKPIKLSKRQKKRIKLQAKTKVLNSKKKLLHSNELIRTCSFCGKATKSTLIKPNKLISTLSKVKKQTGSVTKNKIEKVIKEKTKAVSQNFQSSVYCKSKMAFSLKDRKNTLPGIVKVSPKIIKNNKKKKDKFAGLCKQAVVAAAESKKKKENKLDLFLKPAS